MSLRVVIRCGGIANGPRNAKTRLSEDQVRAIRSIPTQVSASTVGRRFGVAKATIIAIRQGRTWRHLMLACTVALLPAMAAAQTLSGSARIVDGDTLEVAGQRIRLWGIDAPERGQTCGGRDGRIYECGRDAAAVLAELARGRVVCEPRERDRYGRIVAVCRTDAGDLGAAMVRRGWAVDYTRYSRGAYRAEEAAARAERLGIWAGRFDMPETWRRKQR